MRTIVLKSVTTPASVRAATLAALPDTVELWPNEERHDKQAFLKLARYAGDEDVLLLHDALEFTHGFEAKMANAISLFPNLLINGFCLKPTVTETKILPAHKFMMNYCVYFPPGMLANLEWTNANFLSMDSTGPWADTLLLDYLKFEGKRFVQIIPSLVQTTNSHRKAIYWEP